MKYGASVISGNRIRPNTSTGTAVRKRSRLRRVVWTNRDKFAITSTVSPSYSRTNASTRGLSPVMNSIAPRPNSRYSLRFAIRRFIHHSSDDGFACCASTLIAS